MQTIINDFLKDLSKNPRWTSFKAEVRKKLNSELTRLKESIGHSTWQTAEKNYNQIIKKLTLAQKKVDLEVQKTLKSIKKSASEVEKTIGQYKTIALKQKARVKQTRPVKKAAAPAKRTKRSTLGRKKASKS